MPAHNLEQAAALLEAGKRDLLTLQLLNETGRAPHETIGFHAQQACEKFIKAALVLHGITFERTHDLIVLYQLLEEQRIGIPADEEKLRALNTNRNWQINQPIFDGRGRWLAEMTEAEKEQFKNSPAQAMLEQFGYVSDATW
jgi:HEPN domain-containing protein